MPYTLGIQVVLRNTVTMRYYLPEDDILRSRNIIGIAVRRQNTAGDRQTITGNALVADDVLAVSFLSLQSDGVNMIDRLPFDLVAVNPDSENIQYRYIPLELPNGFNPTKSFIDIVDATNLVAGTAYEITFIYQP